MIKIIILILIIIIFLITLNYEHFKINKKKNFFKIIVTTYNPGINFLNKCLKSIENQSYKHFDVCILDDASTKNSKKLKILILHYCIRNNWKYIFRSTNIGPLGGRVNAIEKLKPSDDDIIVSIDGDDELYSNDVLEKLNKYYDENVWITFGNYVDINKNIESKPKIKCKRYNFKNIYLDGAFRKTPWVYSHLKTFRYKLYKRIAHQDLMINGEYIKSATDMALMYPMLEMCGDKFKCVNEVLYKYNISHPESHNIDKKKQKSQKKNSKYVRSLTPYTKDDIMNNKFKIIVTTYNPGIEYIIKCLNSIEIQDYKKYQVCVVDDCSTKDSNKIKDIIKKYCKKNNWKYIFNSNNLGMINSFILATEVLECDDEDILVSIDGDDRLFNNKVFTNLNDKYDKKTLVTFGNFVTIKNNINEFDKSKCNQDWYKIFKEKSFRTGNWYYSHLKTFKYKVFKQIDKKDFKINGKFVKSATDRALMYPILEMVGDKFKCINEPLYVYNSEHLESNNTNKNKRIQQTFNSDYFVKKDKYSTIF